MDIDDIYVCIHDDDDYCDCRKPKIGMLKKASFKYNIDLNKSYLIGDRWKDIECGQIAKCKESFFIDYSYDEPKPIGKFKIVKSLFECAMFIEKLEVNNGN